MKNILFLLMLVGFIWGGQAQVTEKESHSGEKQEKPKGSWKVNKEFDEDGNLIRYDSVYTWGSDDKTFILSPSDFDSLFGQIPQLLDPIGKDMSEFFRSDPFFRQFFGRDSAYMSDHTPYSTKELEEMLRSDSLWIDQSDIDQLMDEMERLRQEFLRQMRREPKVPAAKDTLRE